MSHMPFGCGRLGGRLVSNPACGCRVVGEIEQWRENSSTDDTLTSLTSIETLIAEIREMNHAILREEEDAATEFPSILKLMIKNISITGNNPLIRQWWYDVMTSRPPLLSKNEEK